MSAATTTAAFRMGRSARHGASNPYEPGTPEAADWHAGWMTGTGETPVVPSLTGRFDGDPDTSTLRMDPRVRFIANRVLRGFADEVTLASVTASLLSTSWGEPYGASLDITAADGTRARITIDIRNADRPGNNS